VEVTKDLILKLKCSVRFSELFYDLFIKRMVKICYLLCENRNPTKDKFTGDALYVC